MTDNAQGFPIPSSAVVDPKTGKLTPIWVRFFLSIWNRTGGGQGTNTDDVFIFSAIGGGEIAPSPDEYSGGAIATITVGASPFSYTATAKGNVWVAPGTYAGVTLTRSATTLDFGKVTRGIFPVSKGDILEVTYDTLTPTMYFIPV